MDRRIVMKRTGIAGIIASGIAPAVHAQAIVRWRLASSFPKTLDVTYGAAEVFSKQVLAMSGGKFEISIHPAGELVPAFGVLDAVQQGSVDACHTVPYYYVGKNEAFALGSCIPFGLSSRQMTAWMQDGNGRKLMRDFYAGYNLVNFLGGNTGTQMGGWFRKEIKSVADVKGLKFRIGGLGGQIFSRMGAVPQSIPAGELYAALEKGTIDAAEWSGPYDDQRLGLQKVAPFYYYPGWWEGGPQIDFYVNAKMWEALPAEFKAIVENASLYAHTDMQSKFDARNPPALRQLVGSGAKLRPFPADMMNLAYKTAMALYDEISSKNESWKKIYSDFIRFRGDQNLWFRFAEASFDRFMQAQKD